MKEPSIVIAICDAHLGGIYTRKLERAGFETVFAESMEEVEKKASKLRPSVLIMDTGCVADAVDEIKRLRSLPTLLKTKIVVLGHESQRREIAGIIKAGASEYFIFGHFGPQELVQKMRKLIE